MITLYDNDSSPACQRVRLVLAEKKIEWARHELLLSGDQFSPEYIKVNPNSLVPSLIHDGHVMLEASVICHYLNDAFPDAPLMPVGPLRRARVHTLSKLIDEQVHAACEVLSIATVYRQKTRATKLVAWPESPAREASERLKQEIASQGLDGEAAQHASMRVSLLAERAGRYLAKTPFMAGETASLADIAMFPYFYRLQLIRLTHLWKSQPSLDEWLVRMKARPSFVEAIGRFSSSPDVRGLRDYMND